MSDFHHLDIESGPFDLNECGLWCPSCGDLIAALHSIDEFYQAPGECRQCGFPDDIEAMADYHCGD